MFFLSLRLDEAVHYETYVCTDIDLIVSVYMTYDCQLATPRVHCRIDIRDLHGDGDRGNPAEPAGKLVLRGSRGDGNKCCGTPAGMERYFTGFPRECGCIDFMLHLHRQNGFTVHFFRMQNVGCLITMITQIGTSASANVEMFYY